MADLDKYDDNIELHDIKEILEELILNYKKNKTNSHKLLRLSKALYIIDNFNNINFDGYLRIESGYRNEHGSNYFVMTISSDEIILCQERYEKGEYGGDSIYNEYFNSNNIYGNFEKLTRIDEWKNMFYDLSQNGLNFSIDDMIEDLEEVESEEE